MEKSNLNNNNNNDNNSDLHHFNPFDPNSRDVSLTFILNDNDIQNGYKEVLCDQNFLTSPPASDQEWNSVSFIRLTDEASDSYAVMSSLNSQVPEEASDEFVSQDAETLDVTNCQNQGQVIDADPTLESLIVGDPSVVQSHGPPGNSDPILLLDQDQFNTLENVLQSAEAKGILGDVLVPLEVPANVTADDALVDMITGTNVNSDVMEGAEPSSKLENETSSESKDEQDAKPVRRRGPPKRRSQRQMDREIKEEAERIRMQNQAVMKEEEEAAKKKNSVKEEEEEEKPVTAQGRPKRERKIPAHLKSGDFESAFDEKVKPKSNQTKKQTKSEQVKQEETEVKEKEEKEEVFENEADEDEEEDEDQGSEGGWNSEDDPERLWCICKQPHNNRFMICCDTCMDWYHGKCVGITKKMGKEMEEAGNEWRCPKCKKKEDQSKDVEAKPDSKKKLTETPEVKRKIIMPKKTPTKTVETAKQEKSEIEKKPKEKLCFNCEKSQPQSNSLYCSSDCITSHVTKALSTLRKSKDIKLSQPVMVMDPKANRILTGPNAPTGENLEVWMQKHPTFHVVIQTSTPTSKFYGSKKSVHQAVKSPKIVPPHKVSDQQEVNRRLAEYRKHALSSLSAARDKHRHSSEGDPAKKSETKGQENRNNRKGHVEIYPKVSSSAPKPRRESSSAPRRSSSNKSDSLTPTQTSKDSRPIRDNCLRGLEVALQQRVNKCEDVKVEGEKLKKLVKEIEDALYRLYNKDVGHKYKNKYRSLLFNIKDEKNNGLFRKIINGKISPKTLVNMTPEEMASKELQQWRQAELKHDIEKIKSFELDQMAHGGKVVLKSHKGEEILESKQTTKMDILPDDLKLDATKRSDPYADWGPKTWEHGKHKFESTCDICTKKKSMDDLILAKKEKEKLRERRRKEKEKSKKSSKDRHHSTRDKEKHRHHQHSSSHKHKRDDNKHKDSKTKSQDGTSKEESKSKSSHSPERKQKVEDTLKKSDTLSEENEELMRQQSVTEKLDKAERILAEFKKAKILRFDPVELEGEEEVEQDDGVRTPPLPAENPVQDLSPAEVSSTVNIVTPETSFDVTKENPKVWNGVIDMPDVARFSVSAHSVSGTTDYLTMDLKETLKIAGRIDPETVWDYIVQVTEAPTREILVLRLQASSEDEKEKYNSFYSYLEGRNRFAVVGNNSRMVKDCYILPLKSDKEIHPTLTPLNGPGLEEKRPNMLLALIVRSKRKRSSEQANFQDIRQKKEKIKRGHSKDTDEGSSKMSKLENSSKVMYDPLSAGNAQIAGANSDEDVYDPESAFGSAENEYLNSENYDASNPKFSPPDHLSRLTQPIKSSNSGGFTEELAKLTKEAELRKTGSAKQEDKTQDEEPVQESRSMGPAFATDIAKSTAIGPAPVKGFSGLPSTIANILFGSQNPNGSSEEKVEKEKESKKSLSSMSDADLLAKVQEMEADSEETTTTDQQRYSVPPPPQTTGYPQENIPLPPGPPMPPAPPSFNPSHGWNEHPPPHPMPFPPPMNSGTPNSGPWMQGFEPASAPPPGTSPWQGMYGDQGGYDQNRRHEHHDRQERWPQFRGNRGGFRPYHPRGGAGGRWRGDNRRHGRGSRDSDEFRRDRGHNNSRDYDRRRDHRHRKDDYNRTARSGEENSNQDHFPNEEPHAVDEQV